MLIIEDVNKSYQGPSGDIPVLNGVSLHLAAGRSLALTGDSGSGKSTLLHLAAALDQADSGRIMVDGISLEGLDDAGRAALRRQQVSLVFQQFNLVPALTVAQNISLHARLAGRVDPGWIEALTERLGLAEYQGRYPEQLSGGQQQRVAIARALAMRPKLLLADEPTGNLDEGSSASVMALMLDLVRETGAALLLVTHSQAIASQLDQQRHLSKGRLDTDIRYEMNSSGGTLREGKA
ncbi:ABC-type antimicrobial peptide transport system, ATPase component [Phaeobacter piscinae]|uniref:ABC-type antimicrobial peptide transport system, ATPase component n=1 Tax=Phaeobacter piscinae TaxID=1580596 RepID=A0ABN5DF86_9RHOB|nr:ABC transporter ATP-binding protein [Phaeobacter piscinae]ATG35684.1 ABC-type antimicrobial peptide transport system, ATPase component [Phaeobacter piscinae]AUQ86205.1 ABC-type antimicrobial peptide transport system, ATPase component [Phaeobacter piscinae]AUR24088.1 ABC-type antimicrobial peptide transport system, ATPase component [Phaeobacter piscinae]